MANVTRKIGLSLGADLCWPLCFEELVKRLDLKIPIDGDTIEFDVKRVVIEPFSLRQPCEYDVVIDRLTHWYHTSREWIKKSILMDDLYTFNNPWSLQSMEKHTSYAAMTRLGLQVPETWMVPPKEYEPDATPDLQPTLERYARFFDLGEVGRSIGYPMFMKPYDGGAWVGVSRIDNEEMLRKAYEESGKRVMHLQRAVEGFDLFVRCVGVGPQINPIPYAPDNPLHERYQVEFDFLSKDEWKHLRDMTMTINSFFGWDFNSCEALRTDGAFHPIDFANACPDSQVTSLHYHFPWLIKAKVRWALFCAAYQRKKPRNLNWDPYYEIADSERDYREKLSAYAALADERYETDKFQEFCATHLSHIDEVALEFFESDTAKNAVREKVEALFPEHEHEEFTEHFWGLIQFWRKTEADRVNG